MNITTSTFSNSLEENATLEKKLNLNLNLQYKNKSNSSLPQIICNQFNKSLITGINQKSEVSSRHSVSCIKEKNSKLKKRMGINTPIIRLIPENIDKILDDKVKMFEALENLIIDDDNNEINHNDDNDSEEKCNSEKKVSNKKIYTHIDKNCPSKKKKAQSSLEVPKLDFSHIFNYYNKKPLYIQEVKYVSDFLLDNNEDNNSDSDNENKSKKKKIKRKSKKNKSKNKK